MHFLTITVAVYLLYFTVIILGDLARSRKGGQGSMLSGAPKIDFVIAEPQQVLHPESGRPGAEMSFQLATPAVASGHQEPASSGSSKLEEERSILEDLGLERMPDGGIEVTEDNLLTIINQGM